MRQFAILISERAGREIDAARTWWRSNTSLPDAIDDELASAFQLLERVPEMGARVRVRARWSNVRRVHLARTGYHVYYRVDLQAQKLVVVRFWHERRRPPRL